MMKMMRLMNMVLPSCDEVSRLASQAMDEKLTLRKRLALRTHLMLCVWCRRSAGQLETMRNLARTGGPAETLSDTARERMARALEAEDQAPSGD